MGKLRATTNDERRAKRRRILNAAGELFEDWPFRDISIQRIADSSGLAKGTVYLYFATKEELFLAFFDLSVEKWVDGLLRRFNGSSGQLSSSAIGSLFASTVAERTTLIRLFALRHRCLDGDIRPEAVAAHQRDHHHRISNLAAVLGRRTGISLEEATQWLRQIEVIVSGLAQITPARNTSIEFESELRHMATVLLEHVVTRHPKQF